MALTAGVAWKRIYRAVGRNTSTTARPLAAVICVRFEFVTLVTVLNPESGAVWHRPSNVELTPKVPSAMKKRAPPQPFLSTPAPLATADADRPERCIVDRTLSERLP